MWSIDCVCAVTSAQIDRNDWCQLCWLNAHSSHESSANEEDDGDDDDDDENG